MVTKKLSRPPSGKVTRGKQRKAADGSRKTKSKSAAVANKQVIGWNEQQRHAFLKGYHASLLGRYYVAFAMSLNPEHRTSLLKQVAPLRASGLIRSNEASGWNDILENSRNDFGNDSSPAWSELLEGLQSRESRIVDGFDQTPMFFESFVERTGEFQFVASLLRDLSGGLQDNQRGPYELGVQLAELEFSQRDLQNADRLGNVTPGQHWSGIARQIQFPPAPAAGRRPRERKSTNEFRPDALPSAEANASPRMTPGRDEATIAPRRATELALDELEDVVESISLLLDSTGRTDIGQSEIRDSILQTQQREVLRQRLLSGTSRIIDQRVRDRGGRLGPVEFLPGKHVRLFGGDRAYSFGPKAMQLIEFLADKNNPKDEASIIGFVWGGPVDKTSPNTLNVMVGRVNGRLKSDFVLSQHDIKNAIVRSRNEAGSGWDFDSRLRNDD